MKFTGRLTISDADAGSLEFSATQDEAWVQELLERSAPKEQIVASSAKDWASRSKMSLTARVESVGKEYLLSGSFQAQVPSPCSRCGDAFEAPRVSHFHILIRSPKSKNDGDVVDDETIELKTEELDLVEVLSEQLVMLEPIAECPAQKKDGSCTLCHLNPTFSLADDPESAVKSLKESPFAVLEVLKKKL